MYRKQIVTLDGEPTIKMLVRIMIILVGDPTSPGGKQPCLAPNGKNTQQSKENQPDLKKINNIMLSFKQYIKEEKDTKRPSRAVREDIRVALKELKKAVKLRGVSIAKTDEEEGDQFNRDGEKGPTIELSRVVETLSKSKYMTALFTLAHEFGHSYQWELSDDKGQNNMDWISDHPAKPSMVWTQGIMRKSKEIYEDIV